MDANFDVLKFKKIFKVPISKYFNALQEITTTNPVKYFNSSYVCLSFTYS